MLQDRLLKPLQLLARLEPKLLRQLAAGGSVGVERLGLARRPVERQHQLVAQALPEWMRGDQALELAHELRVATTGQVGVDPLLQRRPAQLLEPGDLVLDEGFVGEVGQRGAAPQRERPAQQVGGTRRLRPPGLTQELLETP